MAIRKKTPENVSVEVLIRSRRRCCMCFGLHNDIQQKAGQIAHLDHDRGNHHVENLAFLCLEHHDAYDSQTSQSRGYNIREAKRYREQLYAYMQGVAIEPIKPCGLFPQADYQEALRFHTGTHRSRSAVLAVQHDTLTLEEINEQIPPNDLEWTQSILEGVIAFGWVRNVPTDFGHYELTMNGRHMLEVLASIPEETKRRAWGEVWDPETVSRKYGGPH